MRDLHTIPALFLCLALSVLLLGCTGPGPQETTAQTTASLLSPEEQYALARNPVDSAENRILTYTATQKRTIDDNVFSQTRTGTASYSQLTSGDMTAIVEDTLDFGTFRTGYIQAFCGGKAYAVVNDCYFESDISAQSFFDRQLPAVAVTASLYGSITAQSGQDSTVLTFSQPSALEPWAASDPYLELLSATGTAVLDASGALVQTSYLASYRSGKVLYELELTVKVTVPKALDLSAKHPAHGKDCVSLADFDAPKRLLQVVADVYSAKELSCDAEETVYSQAIPLTYRQVSHYSLSGSGDTLWAKAEHTIYLSDYRGQVTQQTQTDLFQNGVFTSSVNGGDPREQSWVTAKRTRQTFEDDILSGLMAVKYLASATFTEEDAYYRLELAGNDSFCQELMAGISEFLEVDLDAQSESYETLDATGYLHISKATGLPIKLGLSFQRVHTKNGVSYTLTHTLDQTLLFT